MFIRSYTYKYIVNLSLFMPYIMSIYYENKYEYVS
jgi:hypothetical protein